MAAAKRLAKSSNSKDWLSVESLYPLIVSHVKGLNEIDAAYGKLGMKLREGNTDNVENYLTKEDLLMVVQWKFSVGKPRHALMKLLISNSEATIEKQSKASFARARQIPNNGATIKQAMEDLMELKGVGPATASAILALAEPEIFAYMYDETIEAFLPKRSYTIPIYTSMNDYCAEIAAALAANDSESDWTPARVARILWTAARASAYGLEDVTVDASKPSSSHSKGSNRASSSKGDEICEVDSTRRRKKLRSY